MHWIDQEGCCRPHLETYSPTSTGNKCCLSRHVAKLCGWLPPDRWQCQLLWERALQARAVQPGEATTLTRSSKMQLLTLQSRREGDVFKLDQCGLTNCWIQPLNLSEPRANKNGKSTDDVLPKCIRGHTRVAYSVAQYNSQTGPWCCRELARVSQGSAAFRVLARSPSGPEAAHDLHTKGTAAQLPLGARHVSGTPDRELLRHAFKRLTQLLAHLSAAALLLLLSHPSSHCKPSSPPSPAPCSDGWPYNTSNATHHNTHRTSHRDLQPLVADQMPSL